MRPRAPGSYVVAAVEAGPLSVSQLTKRLRWSPWRTLQILPKLASLGYIERRDGLVYRGPGPASVARKPPEPAPDRVTAPPVEPPVARPTPPPVAPRGACPQCGAVGALRREGRDLYCSQRCGYYLTPGQRRQAA